ncbi:MAG: TatD family hydrolase [Planctomycetota bacterium]
MPREKTVTDFIDSHAHLYFEKFDDDRADVIARARESGFVNIINVGTDATTSRAAIALADEYPGFCYASVGLHPTDAAVSAAQLDELIADFEGLLDTHADRVCAIGETGLDYYWDRATPEDQHRAFRAQMELAARRQLPVIIHCRDANGSRTAMQETLDIVRDYSGRVTGVFHCFGGSAADAQSALDLGWHVSFAGNVTFPKAKDLQDAAAIVPTDRLLLETDAPFLAPQPVRGKRNESAYSLHTLEYLANMHGIDRDQLGAITTANARRLFPRIVG